MGRRRVGREMEEGEAEGGGTFAVHGCDLAVVELLM